MEHGIRFTQEDEGMLAHIAIPGDDEDEPSFPITDGVYTDANWGPQDASRPKEGELIHEDEVKSLLGHVIFRQGGPIVWGCTRELDTISRSSCESEIYATDEGTKSIQTVRHILQDLGLPDGTDPTPIYNDNKGCVDWTQGCSVSRNLRHVNLRNMAVRMAIRNQEVKVFHIPGKKNIADILTKEHKDVEHFCAMMQTITSPRVLVDSTNIQGLRKKGGVKTQGSPCVVYPPDMNKKICPTRTSSR